MNRPKESIVFYTRLQRRLHWWVLILVFFQYVTQAPMRDALDVIEQGGTLNFFQFLATTQHTWGGASIAALMLWRWQLRKRVVPVAGGQLSTVTGTLVQWHHRSLYVILLFMAFTGSLNYFGGIRQAARWHEWGEWLLLVLIGVHIAGALSHVGASSKVFQRMMGRSRLR